ncbi:hypothetical protein [Calditerricola satsumensis]|uniref:Uncharacterized protein n=1 Tax=Calditerricola satsumensis TaxID=373054 RepID=A0A8J3FCX2_9BACI|nr:hypothetical protein [Calditerricola satsumensis]GGK08112.1 hypothetical protein GCM10007043_22740 [Calditerricola satsumensis]
MNKREWARFAGVGVLTALALAAQGAWANGVSAPGSVDDPLVTKSYVDARINELRLSAPGGGASLAYTVVTLQPGDALIAKSSLELIIRSPGTVLPILNAYGEGLSDLTGGRDWRTTAALPRDHLFVVPRPDGRGIVASPANKSAVYVMVRGAYEIRQG